MKDPVIFPDAVLLVVTYLRTKLPTTLVYSRVPEELPPEFIRVQRLGGLQNSPVTDRPRINVECWSDTEFNAADLAARTRAHMSAIEGKRGDTTVYRLAEVSGPMWLPDQKSGHPRYSFAVEFSTRGKRME